MSINPDSLPPTQSNQTPSDPPPNNLPPIPPLPSQIQNDPPPADNLPPIPSITTQPQPPPQTPPLTTPPQPAVPPSPELQPETKKGFSVKKLLFIFLIVIILLFGGASIALAYTDYKLMTPPRIIKNSIDRLLIATPLPKTPRLILERSQAKMAKVKTVVLEIESESSTTSPSAPVKGAKVKIKGPFDLRNQAGIQLEISGEIALEGMEFSAAGEVRQIDDYLYFKLTQFPGGSFLPLDQFKNQWFYVNIEELKKENRPAEDEQKIQKVIEIFQKFQAKSYQWAELDKSTKDTYVLKITLPKSELDNLFLEIIEVLEPKDQSGLETSIEKASIQKLTEKLQDTQLTIKIGKKDYLVKESTSSLSFDIDTPTNLFSSSGSISLAPTASIPISLSATVKFSDYNQPVIVEIPDGAKDLKKYTEQLQKDFEKSFNLPSSPEMYQLPQESTPSASPEPESGLRDYFSSPSPVLGQQSYWDLLLLNSLRQIL